ncbi:MAG: serine protein kinase RIO [Candidatus Bathyarchaeia archaeon]
MDDLSRIEARLRRKEERYEIEQRMLEKRSEEYEALEEVFDKPTLITLYRLMRQGIIAEIFGAVKAGKESKLYWGKAKGGEELAIKIFLTISAEFRKGMMKYIDGDPRFRYVKKDSRALISLWASKEFRNLKEAYGAKVRVPKPIYVKENVLIMEFIGKEGRPAPLLKEVEVKNPRRIYGSILRNLRRLYRYAGLIHGDMSEYNVMMWRGWPVLFDFSQAVSREHPNAMEFLRRDLSNLNRYFEALGLEVEDVESILQWIAGVD